MTNEVGIAVRKRIHHQALVVERQARRHLCARTQLFTPGARLSLVGAVEWAGRACERLVYRKDLGLAAATGHAAGLLLQALHEAQPYVAPETVRRIPRLLATQDNRCTAHPLFIVQQRRRLYGIDTDFCDGHEIAWLFDGDEWPSDDPERIKAEAEYDRIGEVPGDWTRTGFQDSWEFVTACFTEQGCKDYLARDGHNLTDPRIYVTSGYRNQEWIDLRAFFAALEAGHEQ